MKPATRAPGAHTFPLAPLVRAEEARNRRNLALALALKRTPEVSALIAEVRAQGERLRSLLAQAKRTDAANRVTELPHRVGHRPHGLQRRPACRRRRSRPARRRGAPPDDPEGAGHGRAQR